MHFRRSIKFAAATLLFGFGAVLGLAGPNDPPVTKGGKTSKDTKAVDTKSVVSADYKIGAGDVVGVHVWKEPDASVDGIVVRSDGKVSIPLLKDVEIQGMTTGEAERMLAKRFAELIPGADVTVLVRESRSKKVYLMGAVKREGPLPLQAQLTVLQALAEGGGFTDFAKPRKIYVIRIENGKQKRLPFDYEAVISGDNPGQDFLLQPNDMIYVPK